jgi:divalent metal cation (Fe/Co/Zn/Cd) transporter
MEPATMRTTTDLDRRATRLAQLTIGWNVLEGIVAIASGAVAGSVALIGFGLDSFVEVFAATVVLWQLHGVAHDREERALRLIAWTFFALAAYVTISSAYDVATASEPHASTPGIVLAALSLLVMPVLAQAKRRTGQAMGRATVVADSTQTLLCTYLSVVLLVGLVLNATIGWWWADPLAGLVIAALAVREGREAWRGDQCC